MLTEEGQQEEATDQEDEEDVVVMMKIIKIMDIDVVDHMLNVAATAEMKAKMGKTIKFEPEEREEEQEVNVVDIEAETEEANGVEEEAVADNREVDEEDIRMMAPMDMNKTSSMALDLEATVIQTMENQAAKRNH